MKRIILEDGKIPQFEEQWTVGEVTQMADALMGWVNSLTVNVTKSKSAPKIEEDIDKNEIDE